VAEDARKPTIYAGSGPITAARALRLLAAVAAIAFAVAVVGGYALGWTWTGFADNDTVWEWLQLLVLPLVLAVSPVWYGTRRELRSEWRIAALVIAAVFVVLLIGGYEGGWTWTGFDGRTLWDWLELMVLPAAVTVSTIWLSTGRSLHPRLRLAAVGMLVGFALLVPAGYGFDWHWTGFPGNTLWDWLHLLLVPFVLPVMLVWFATRGDRAEPGLDLNLPGPAEAGS